MSKEEAFDKIKLVNNEVNEKSSIRKEGKIKMREIILGTNNQGKINEMKEILKETEVISLKEAGIDIDVEEDKDTFEENALKKATEITKITKKDGIADDSGLCIEALNGFPGVQTKRFLGEEATDEQRNDDLLKKLERFQKREQRKAKMVTCIALKKTEGEEFIFRGELNGYISLEKRGSNGFGFDQIFEIEDGRTLAELEAEEKNKISSRKIALEKLKDEILILENENKIPIFLKEMLEKQYGKEKTEEIMKGYERKRKVTFRVNTLKTTIEEVTKKLKKEAISYQRVSWSKEAFIIDELREKEIETLEMYQKGEIYLQSLSSMLPPILLEPKEKESILDMAAAPGSKTTQMAAISKNQALITACEKNPIRAERLKYNLEKQGATSAYVMVTDARKLDDFFAFDKILLDAPCSGSGIIQISELNKKQNFNQKLIEKSCEAQINLLKKAIKILKSGKEMIYSTCSILNCENEKIIEEVLKSKQVEIVPIELENQEDIPILPTNIKGTLCVCPNELYEGFFVAKLRKK